MLCQQGDVLIETVEELPQGLKLLEHRRLAEGEATGHFHGADAGKLLTGPAGLFLDAPDGTTILHQEHKPITLPPGRYRIRPVVEYDHFAEEAAAAVRHVVD